MEEAGDSHSQQKPRGKLQHRIDQGLNHDLAPSPEPAVAREDFHQLIDGFLTLFL